MTSWGIRAYGYHQNQTFFFHAPETVPVSAPVCAPVLPWDHCRLASARRRRPRRARLTMRNPSPKPTAPAAAPRYTPVPKPRPTPPPDTPVGTVNGQPIYRPLLPSEVSNPVDRALMVYDYNRTDPRLSQGDWTRRCRITSAPSSATATRSSTPSCNRSTPRGFPAVRGRRGKNPHHAQRGNARSVSVHSAQRAQAAYIARLHEAASINKPKRRWTGRADRRSAGRALRELTLSRDLENRRERRAPIRICCLPSLSCFH